MVFWITATALSFAVAAILALTLLRKKATESHPAEYDLRVYRDQLSEIERDLARGTIAKDDAERIRAEVGRRVLAADAQLQRAAAGSSQPRTATIVVSALVLFSLAGGAAALYPVLGAPGARDIPRAARIEASDQNRLERPSQAEFEAQLSAQPTPPPSDAQYAEIMEKLRKTVEDRPDDLQGQQLLARNEATLGNYKASYIAQNQIIRLKGDKASAADYAVLAEMMIRAVEGYVSPEAEAALKNALELDPRFPSARYFTALMHAQNDRPDIAFRLMDNLLSESSSDAPWVPAIRNQIEELAWRAGVRYNLPEISDARGPSSGDMAAAADLSPEERKDMIRDMVEGLSERLANDGGSAEEWARLISSLGVLGETDRARDIWQEAQQTFAQHPDLLGVVRQGAARAGLTNGNSVEPQTSSPSTLSGPSREDIENASEMSPEARQEMIQGMVDRLAERLNAEGGTVHEWARLITSQASLGNHDAAQTAFGQAKDIFAKDPSAMATIRTSARTAGLIE